MPTENNNQASRHYEKQFRALLQAIFAAQSYFGDFFAGWIGSTPRR